MGKLFNSKAADVFFAVLLSFFAWNRYEDGHTGVAILLVIIALLNVVSLAVKVSIDKKVNQDSK